MKRSGLFYLYLISEQESELESDETPSKKEKKKNPEVVVDRHGLRRHRGRCGPGSYLDHPF